MFDSFVTPWTVAHQASLSRGILQARILEWEKPFPSLGDLPDPGIKPTSLHWQADSLPLSHQVSLTLDIYLLKLWGVRVKMSGICFVIYSKKRSKYSKRKLLTIAFTHLNNEYIRIYQIVLLLHILKFCQNEKQKQ